MGIDLTTREKQTLARLQEENGYSGWLDTTRVPFVFP